MRNAYRIFSKHIMSFDVLNPGLLPTPEAQATSPDYQMIT